MPAHPHLHYRLLALLPHLHADPPIAAGGEHAAGNGLTLLRIARQAGGILGVVSCRTGGADRIVGAIGDKGEVRP